MKTKLISIAVGLALATGAYAGGFDLGEALNNTVNNAVHTVTHPDEAIRNIGDQVRRDPLGAAINPGQFTNPTGLPQPGDFAQMAIERPQDLGDMVSHPENIFGSPLYAALESARNRALSSNVSGIPPEVRDQLSPYFPAEVLDNVQWTSDWGALNGLPQTIAMGCGAYAITLVDVVVFRNEQLAHNPVLWAHELTHVQQYSRWGTPEFARRYTFHSGDVENEAYAHENEIRQALSQSQMPQQGFFNNGNMSVASGWQPANMCVTPAVTCSLMGPQPVGTGCGCRDMYGRPWMGIAR